MKATKLFANLLILGITLCSYSGFAQKSPGNAEKEKLVNNYYEAYVKKDWHELELILADEFTFTSPNGDDHIDLNTYKERCWPNAQNTKRFELEKLVIDGDNAFVIYNGLTNKGEIFRNTEYFKFKNGKIVSNECFFGPGKSFPNNTKK